MSPEQEAAHRLCDRDIGGPWTAEGLFEYTDAAGHPLYWKIRARLPNEKKWIKPMHKNGAGFKLGEPVFAPGKKPLYRLCALASEPEAPVWWVEGEQKADALAKMWMCATTAGGANSEGGVDLGPLAGRTVTIWPDNDTAGVAHAERVRDKLEALRCRVEMIDAGALALSDGGDVIDWLKLHTDATGADLAKLPRVAQPRPALTSVVNKRSPSSAEVVCLADVAPEPIVWLWDQRIALGKLTLIAGDPDLGKSLMTLSIAAAVTTGARWPVSGGSAPLGEVILLSAEDDIADTIRPRVDAAGGDASKVHVIKMICDIDPQTRIVTKRGFSLRRDITILEEVLAKHPACKLVCIDPISAYLDGTDSHTNAAVRGLLTPLAEMAAKFKVALVAVSHLNKGGGQTSAMYRITASLAFVAAARAVYAVIKDKDDDARRLVLLVKNNLSVDRSGMAYRIGTAANDSPRIEWEAEPVAISADEAMGRPEDSTEQSELSDAQEFLRGLLAEGAVSTKQIMADANGAGYAWATVRRAQKLLGVEARKDGMKGPWKWALAPKALKSTEDAHPKGTSTFGAGEHLREPGDDESEVEE